MIVAEVVGGTLGMGVGGFLGVLLGVALVWATHADDYEGMATIGASVPLGSLGLCLGSGAGVSIAGSIAHAQGSTLLALSGGILGCVVSGALLLLPVTNYLDSIGVSQIISGFIIVLPILTGAVVGYNILNWLGWQSKKNLRKG
jgi:hypothetical protein